MDPDNEAPRDPRAGLLRSNFTERDFEGHRALSVYVGFHVPSIRHRGHHRHHHHHRKSKELVKPVDYGMDIYKPGTPPSQRVHFILGADDDEMHRPHPVFSEMEELFVSADGEEMEWRETARWVKFEEDVEEGGQRWSKPHVATISLHSLLVLRSCFLNGTVMLDMDASDLEEIADNIFTKMVSNVHITEDQHQKLTEVLLCRHRHFHEFRHDWGEKGSKLNLMKSFSDMAKSPSSPTAHVPGNSSTHSEESVPNENLILFPEEGSGASGDSHPSVSPPEHPRAKSNSIALSDFQTNEGFMKKIPPDAHASNILIGELPDLDRTVTAFVRLGQACRLGDLTEVPIPTKFLFIVLTPQNNGLYHEVGRAFAAIMSDEVFHDVAYKAKTSDDLLAGVDEFMDAATVLPAGVWDPNTRIEPPSHSIPQEGRLKSDVRESSFHTVPEVCDMYKECGLRRTGRLFGGLVDDVRRKAPWYFSDFKDFFALQSIASVFFLYIACLAPVITFGGLLGDATKQRMAAMENMLSSVICGIVYGLFSGQPLTLLGTTGALLVFEGTIFSYCEWWAIEYLSFRLWIGLWTAGILFLFVAFDACVLVCYITRFTEEIFATLISIAFIFQAFENVINIRTKFPMKSHSIPRHASVCHCIYKRYIENGSYVNITHWVREDCEENGEVFFPENCNYWQPYFVPNVYLMSVILFATTFAITVILRKIKTSAFFPKKVRSVMSDFAVTISIGSMTFLDFYIGIDTPKLDVPQEFKPTWSKRGWLIPFFGNNSWWTAIGAILPALVATILIFMDQEITAIIVNRKENRLKKSCGYHLDLFILAILIAVCSVFGLPWFVAATILSMTHVMSLRKVSQCSAPGEKPLFLGVREQRGTHVCVFILVGFSIFFTPILKHIPMPVLYGAFLYMGVVSLKGLQFLNRVLILFMPIKYQPDYIFLRHVPVRIVHLFTAIQILALIILFVIKYFPESALCFPAVLILVILIRRRLLVRVFTETHLTMLDDDMPEFAKQSTLLDSFGLEGSYQPTYITLCGVESDKSDIGHHDNTDANRCSINITEILLQSSIWKCIDQQSQKTPPLQEKGKRSSCRRKKKSNENTSLSTLEEETDSARGSKSSDQIAEALPNRGCSSV